MDHITGGAIYPPKPAGHQGATTELKLDYVAPLRAGTVDAHATVIAVARRSAVVRGEIQGAARPRAQGTITVVAPRMP